MGRMVSEPQDASEPRPSASKGERLGRRIAMGLYYATVLAIIVSSTWQITRQLFFFPEPTSPYHDCREGLEALVTAVERARGVAPGTDGEDAAIRRFRVALGPAWGYRDQIAASCTGAHEDERALDAIERLRYAEEHAVRREAGDLAPLRRKIGAILAPGRPAPTAP
jgi:hypothetical protein